MNIKKNQQGFSLIELLIVVVIIGIIAAIAIPNLLASRRAANEGSAIGSLRTFHGANATYHATLGKNKSFANDPADLSQQELIDSALAAAFLANGIKSGYGFTYNGATSAGNPTDPASRGNQPSYFANADPQGASNSPTRTGTRHFYIDGSGVIREEDGAAAANTSDPIS